MSIRPVDMQIAVSRAQELGKAPELNADKTVLQEAFKTEMQKQVDRNMEKVIETRELEKLVDENGHNKREQEKQKKKRKKEEEDKQEELHNFEKSVTQTGSVFDFKA